MYNRSKKCFYKRLASSIMRSLSPPKDLVPSSEGFFVRSLRDYGCLEGSIPLPKSLHLVEYGILPR